MTQSPPEGLSPPQQALWWLEQGNFTMGEGWQKAHDICQTREGSFDYDLVHALAHWIEDDIGNRDYWYRRVGVKDRAATIEAEWARVKAIVR